MQYPKKTAWTIAVLVALVAAGAKWYQLFPAQTAERLLAFHEPRRKNPPKPELPVGPNFGKYRQAVAEGSRAGEKPLPEPGGARRSGGELALGLGGVEPVWDASNHLDHFYEALAKVEKKEAGAAVRIAHYGDSPTTADLITADVRELLQRQFGDAGHGYYLIDKPWAWYAHRGVASEASGWESEPATTAKIRDGMYGYGGVSFRGGAGARARFKWAKNSEHNEVEIGYFRQAQGGTVRVEACGAKLGEIEMSGEAGSAFAKFALAPECKELALQVQSGRVRLYGVSLRREASGVIYDSLGINGAYISVLSKFLKPEHWADQLRHYQPDLVVINYGTNESVYAAFVDKVFEKELRETIQRARRAVPEASILVMSPMDRGVRGASGAIETVPAIEKLVEIERRVAEEEKVAFFSTFTAMGGNGTMREWYEGTPRLVGADFIHPMPAGAKRIGEYLYRALLDGFNHYKSRKQGGVEVAGAPAGQNN